MGHDYCGHECDCICHINKNIVHVRACCTPCKICGRRIKFNLLEKHTRICHKDDGGEG